MPWWKSAGGRCLVTRSPFSPSADGPDRLVPFKTVVREGTVRDAFSVSFPDLNVEYVLMTMATAERYLASMQSRFSQWKAIRGAERRFVIAGGFMNPSKMPRTTQDEPWTVIEFMPLQMGEITPAYGCRVPGDDAFWQTQATKCRNQCKDPECVDSCIQPFKQALDQEVSTRQTFRALDIPASSKPFDRIRSSLSILCSPLGIAPSLPHHGLASAGAVALLALGRRQRFQVSNRL